MTGHQHLIARKPDHLQRMRRYLEQHEMLAAYRVRFSEFQERPGTTVH